MIRMYRAYREWCRSRPGVADLVDGVVIVLTFVVSGAVLYPPLHVGFVVGPVIGVTIGMVWRRHRRRKSVRTG